MKRNASVKQRRERHEERIEYLIDSSYAQNWLKGRLLQLEVWKCVFEMLIIFSEIMT